MCLLATLAAMPLLLLVPAMSALALDEPDIEFFYPIVTRRPVIERELELSAGHEKGRYAVRAAVAWEL